MNVGDMVVGIMYSQRLKGIVIDVFKDIAVPPTIEVLWEDDEISSWYQDDLEIMGESRCPNKTSGAPSWRSTSCL